MWQGWCGADRGRARIAAERASRRGVPTDAWEAALERYRAALDEAAGLMRQARRSAGQQQWHDAAAQLRRAREELDRAAYELLRLMRAAGLTWPEIGRELGQSKQQVAQQYQRYRRRFGDASPPPGVPRPGAP